MCIIIYVIVLWRGVNNVGQKHACSDTLVGVDRREIALDLEWYMTSVHYQPQKHVLLGEIKGLRDISDRKLLPIIANVSIFKMF